MMGKTHFKIGVLSAGIAAAVPQISSVALLHNKYIHMTVGKISIAGIIVAGIAALMVDVDSEHSKINQVTPAGVFTGAMNFIQRILQTLLMLLLTVGLGVLILTKENTFIHQARHILGHNTTVIVRSTGIVLILIGIFNSEFVKYVPILNIPYKILNSMIHEGTEVVKKIIIKVFYIGAGVLLIYYNFKTKHDPVLYLGGLLLIGAAVFPHRTFFHSIEGAISVNIVAIAVLNKLGFKSLTGYFLIGYISHIYWADIFTVEGVPLFSTPVLLKKLFDKLGLKNNNIFTTLSINIKLPPFMRTGSFFGNAFETAYVMTLFIVSIILIHSHGVVIKLI